MWEEANALHRVPSHLMIILAHKHRKMTQVVSKLSCLSDTRRSQVSDLPQISFRDACACIYSNLLFDTSERQIMFVLGQPHPEFLKQLFLCMKGRLKHA